MNAAISPQRPARNDAHAHLYKIGQSVRLMSGYGHHPQYTNLYRVTGTLPPMGASPQYRIRSDYERYERVALEGDLELVRAPQTAKATKPLLEKAFG
jgi:hypothetical protein